ncbi:Homeobox TGIF1 [Lecanosticta acicola]|uniref:Homeobox TGIF1 n=1 Tax=Lecanosticta acicola TaxID=111012 RepID=A0AAI8W1B2_9PEZI|nr:Homeobox TGIF1 [Lecanosticta acicola]
MPTIDEEMDGDLPFGDLPDSELVGSGGASPNLTTAHFPAPGYCLLHPHATNCLCNAFIQDCPLSHHPVDPPSTGLEEPDYSRFENWLPRFVRPEKPCDYCRSRRLNCYVQRGEPHCTPCASLFRECSLSNTTTLEANNQKYGEFLDTLHLIDENTAKERGSLTGIKPLKSKPGGSGTHTPVRADDAPGSSKRNGIRFPRHAVKILRDWVEAHAHNPYPTEDEKAELERETGLAPIQIANWLANARRRRRMTDKSRPKLCESPSLRPTTAAIPIPGADKPWEDLNPFERWKHSPPEHEPASLTDIANAVATNILPDETRSDSPSTIARSSKRRKGSSSGSGWSHRRAPSTTSGETGQTSSISASTSAAHSNGSSHSTHGSFGSFSSSLAGKKHRRRRRRPAALTPGCKSTDAQKRIFQCTFCTDTFRAKYDWTRHEKSLHLSLEKWICAPLGPVITDQETGVKICVYCDLHNPSGDHIESHNHRQCEDKGIDARTFYRKDHLRQHLRLMHGCEMTSSMDNWKSIAVNVNSRCGFCSQRFSVWQERVDHLTAHFKAGARMSEWKGCRGLDPAVAAQVTNAMPPYLIGIESVSPNPFSASNRGTWRDALEISGTDNVEFQQDAVMRTGDNDEGGPSRKTTCWEILTIRLGKYAKEMSDKGMVMTDEMLQRQAREILFESDDPWNQTHADHPEWLDLFKKAHGMNFIPSQIGGQGSQVPEDIETFTDLGLRVPFALQLKAYNQSQHPRPNSDGASRPGPSKSMLKEELYELLSTECSLHDGDQRCEHVACAQNLIDLSPVIQLSGGEAIGPGTRRWCSQKISPEAVLNLAKVKASIPATYVSAFENRMKASQSLPRQHGNASCDGPQNTAFSNRAQALQDLWGLDVGPHEHSESYGEPSANRLKGLPTLRDLELRNHDHNQSCAACRPGDTDHAAAKGRASGHTTSTQHENVACSCSPTDHALIASRNRTRGLATLAGMEAPELDTCSHSKFQEKYLPRHKLELPKDKARLFATTTGAWEDSGVMPKTVETSLPSIQETNHVSTGAMMEFLGGDMGALLPFSHDARTSQIPLPTAGGGGGGGGDWRQLSSEISQEEMMHCLDELLSTTNHTTTTTTKTSATTTSSATAESSYPSAMEMEMEMDWTTGFEVPAGLPADLSMVVHNKDVDVNFDFDFEEEEMDFDGIFDMPLDETFGGG